MRSAPKPPPRSAPRSPASSSPTGCTPPPPPGSSPPGYLRIRAFELRQTRRPEAFAPRAAPGLERPEIACGDDPSTATQYLVGMADGAHTEPVALRLAAVREQLSLLAD